MLTSFGFAAKIELALDQVNTKEQAPQGQDQKSNFSNAKIGLGLKQYFR